MKPSLPVLILLLAAHVCVAQNSQQPSVTSQITASVGLSLPDGEYTDRHNLRPGIAVESAYVSPLDSGKLFVSVSLGYHRFESAGYAEGWTVSIVPLLLGVRYYFRLTGLQPYVGVEEGPYFRSAVYDSDSTAVSNDLLWGVVPRLGFRVALSSTVDLDIALKYHLLLTGDSQLIVLGICGGIGFTIN
jgi:hypothetical protein